MHLLRLIGEVVPPEDSHKKDVQFCLWGDSIDWWAVHGAGPEPAIEYAREFVEGALEIFREVRDRVES